MRTHLPTQSIGNGLGSEPEIVLGSAVLPTSRQGTVCAGLPDLTGAT
jgi:hypothetical protein